MTKSLTPPQLKMLGRFESTGYFTPYQDSYRNKERMLNRMVTMGLVSHYVHGGYAITEAGREILKTQGNK
jgi:hypothetical protein